VRLAAAAAIAIAAACTCACAQTTHAPSATPASASGRAAQVVNATILTNGCQRLGTSSAQLAEHAMNDLVEGCTSIPGGSAHFEASLQPGGRIEIASAPGYEDVVPICVLKHALVHKVPLAKPCRLDVKIEETHVAVP
jgi:hypothetical protein